MGQSVSNFAEYVYDSVFGKMEARIIMVGLDAAGKTSILYKLRIGEVVTTIPTIGFNVETVEYKSLKFTMWDIGGQDRLRPLWRRYYDNADAIIFVVDSADKARLSVARDELQKLLSEESLRDAKILVYANKQDMPNALSISDVTAGLELNSNKSVNYVNGAHNQRVNQEWYVQGCSATRGAGIYEGLDWLATAVKRSRK